MNIMNDEQIVGEIPMKGGNFPQQSEKIHIKWISNISKHIQDKYRENLKTLKV